MGADCFSVLVRRESARGARVFQLVAGSHVQLNGLGFLGGERYEYPVSAEKACSRTPHIVLEDFRGDAKINGVDENVVAGADQ